MNVKLMKNK